MIRGRVLLTQGSDVSRRLGTQAHRRPWLWRPRLPERAQRRRTGQPEANAPGTVAPQGLQPVVRVSTSQTESLLSPAAMWRTNAMPATTSAHRARRPGSGRLAPAPGPRVDPRPPPGSSRSLDQRHQDETLGESLSVSGFLPGSWLRKESQEGPGYQSRFTSASSPRSVHAGGSLTDPDLKL